MAGRRYDRSSHRDKQQTHAVGCNSVTSVAVGNAVELVTGALSEEKVMKITAFFESNGTNEPYAIVTTEQVDGVSIETCFAGQLPDRFRTERFGPLLPLELPPQRATDAEFEQFLRLLRGTPGAPVDPEPDGHGQHSGPLPRFPPQAGDRDAA